MYTLQSLINPHQRNNNIILPAKSSTGKVFFNQILLLFHEKTVPVLKKLKESDTSSSISVKFDGTENSGTTGIGIDFHTLVFSLCT